MDQPKHRISIVGTSGSGKTTLAKRLSRELSVPHVELDEIFWLPGWKTLERDEFRRRTEEALAGDAWVVDGNYSPVRDIIWERADTLIFLNYGFFLVFGRVLWRTIQRVFTGKRLFAGNRERFRQSFLSRDSIILWMVSTYRRRRKEFPRLMRKPEFEHLQVIELRKPVALADLVRRIRT
jgi:adenylate kinase family enzyme